MHGIQPFFALYCKHILCDFSGLFFRIFATGRAAVPPFCRSALTDRPFGTGSCVGRAAVPPFCRSALTDRPLGSGLCVGRAAVPPFCRSALTDRPLGSGLCVGRPLRGRQSQRRQDRQDEQDEQDGQDSWCAGMGVALVRRLVRWHGCGTGETAGALALRAGMGVALVRRLVRWLYALAWVWHW